MEDKNVQKMMVVPFETPTVELKVIHLNLQRGTRGEGGTYLEVVDSLGKSISCGNILFISDDGIVRLCGGINNTMGLQKGIFGQVRVQDIYDKDLT